ncbi:S1 RNA-binding domain-containing protein [candidate division WS5 bacterium]|uniref:S1 RNA-binding domain-containing protein n=1 Tax=candidate division WS5 bacterium TaxID=2093353 RepID=A0A419DCD6_9BACT|nr:MAG: S1 RNA-binding domain-containing protein [candidate division WS5 bacterium]
MSKKVNNSDSQTTTQKHSTMAELMASAYSKPQTLNRGDEVTGVVVSIVNNDVIVDLGTKAEGVLNKKELSQDQQESLKIGDRLTVYVVSVDETGQAVLTPLKATIIAGKDRKGVSTNRWQKFIVARERKIQLQGQIVEVNKGGLLVEVGEVRGFIPSSHIGLDVLEGISDLGELIGKEVKLMTIEVEPSSNRLIFSTRPPSSSITKEALSRFEVGKKVQGKIAGVVPFGLFLNMDGVEGVIFPQEISWEEKDNPTADFQVGQDVEVKVLGKDETLGRVTLSLRQLQKDPFEEKAKDFQQDDVVAGTVTEVTQNGINVSLEDGIDGLVPADKISPELKYEIGQNTNFLVDSIDKRNHRITLAPFLTSTKGLLYR